MMSVMIGKVTLQFYLSTKQPRNASCNIISLKTKPTLYMYFLRGSQQQAISTRIVTKVLSRFLSRILPRILLSIEAGILTGILKTHLHTKFLSRNSMQFLSCWSCNQLRFHCDFSAVCQCKMSVHIYFLNKSCSPAQTWNCFSKSPCFVSCISNHGTEIAAGLHTQFWSCNFSATIIAFSCATNICRCKWTLDRILRRV